jgi:CheY-like chemotaxis protein
MHSVLCSDNPLTRDLVGSILGSEDRLTVCESGMELLATVKAIESDLVILDLETHGLGGLLLISAVQELAPGSPIVAISQDGVKDSRLLLQRGVPFFRLAAGDRDGSEAFRRHLQSRGQAASTGSVSVAQG